jgi:hypothetical protein
MNPARSLLALAAALVVSFASAAQPIFGVTLAPLTPNGFGLGVQAELPVARFDVAQVPVDLTVRADLSTPLNFSVAPNVVASVYARFDLGDFVPYVGTGVGVLWSVIDEEPCWDVSWTIGAGVDYPIDDTFAVRADFLTAPLLGQFIIGVGVAISLDF